MRRILTNPTVRGLAIVALIAFGVVVFSLESAVATVGGILRIAFYLAVAFFLFLVWRDRRSDIESWSERGRKVFYSAIALAVVDIGVLIGLGANGPETAVFVVVLLACGYAVWRVWTNEHRLV
jgi:quinol-cytochrome oxidoreductase complex cytochrome b subunit